mgnify:CR=1 FL=1
MQTGRRQSLFVVAFQFLLFGYFVLTGPLLARRIPCLILEILGLALGTWAALSMNIRRVRVMPDVAPDAVLVTRGPYRVVRHPMYTAVLLVLLALLLDQFSWDRGMAWLLSTVNLVLKLNMEERFLVQRFPPYEEYRKRSWRLCPLVY